MRVTIPLIWFSLIIFTSSSTWAQDLRMLKRRVDYEANSIIDIQNSIDRVQDDLDEIRAEAEKAESIINRVSEMKEEIHKTQLNLPKLEDDLILKEKILKEYKKHFKPKVKLKVGQEFPVLRTVDGKEFKNAKIVKIDKEVSVGYDGGVVAVPVRLLPTEFTNGAIVAPVDSYRPEFFPEALAKIRPTRDLSLDHQSRVAKEAVERKKLQAELDRLKVEDEIRQRELDAKDSAAYNAGVDEKINDLSNEIKRLQGRKRTLDEQAYQRQRAYEGTRIRNQGAHEEYLYDIELAKEAIDEKIRVIEVKQRKLRESKL